MTGKVVRTAGIAVAFALALLPAVPAQEAPDGRHRTFDDSLLDSLVGRWNLSREIRDRRERNTLDVEWVLQHQFLRLSNNPLQRTRAMTPSRGRQGPFARR